MDAKKTVGRPKKYESNAEKMRVWREKNKLSVTGPVKSDIIDLSEIRQVTTTKTAIEKHERVLKIKDLQKTVTILERTIGEWRKHVEYLKGELNQSRRREMDLRDQLAGVSKND